MSIRQELSSFSQKYLEESLKFENSGLLLPFTIWGEFNKPPKNLIVEIVKYENRWKNQLKLLIYDREKNKQKSNLEEVKSFALEIDKAEDRFHHKGETLQSLSFSISLMVAISTPLTKFIMGDNNTAQAVLLVSLLGLFFFSLYIFANSWYYKRLALNTKCLGKTAKEVLDCFSPDNNIFLDP